MAVTGDVVAGTEPHHLRILYLGWAPEPAAALTAAGAQVTVVVPVAERHKPAAEGFSGTVLPVGDPTRVDDVLAGLAATGSDPAGFAAVCTDDEFCVVPAAVLARLGGGSGTPVEVAVALRDKDVQKTLVRKAGLPTAESVRVAHLSEVATCGLAPPLVVKPTAGAGSQRTYPVLGTEDLAALPLAHEALGPWLVEQFVPGEELHVDGVVRGGEVVLASISRYLCNVIEVRRGRLVGSTTLDPDAQGPLCRDVTTLTGRALAALGYRDGVFHLECFHDDGRVVFGECAGRIGGGMIAEAVRVRYGVDLYAELAAAALALPSPARVRPPTAEPGSVGWVNLPCPPGRLEELPDRAAILKRPGVIDAQLWAAPGDRTGDPRQGSHVLVAKALVRAATEEQARAHLLAVGSWFASAVRVDGTELP